jgi:serine/threonine-protein kinase
MVKTIAASLALVSLVLATGQATGQEKAKAEGREAAGQPKDAAHSEAVAREAYGLLVTRCQQCHGEGSAVSDFNIFDREAVLQHVDAKNPRASKLFEMVYTERMPETNNKLSLRELRTVEDWIKLGAPFPKAEKREPISELALCLAIERDLAALPTSKGFTDEDIRHQRYLSLAHLHNNPRISGDDLRLARAAISKLVNSLSREREIKVPEAVDPQQTILRFDLRDYGWKPADWVEVLKKYPYGVVPKNKDVRDTHARIQKAFTTAAANRIPYVRGDWFIARASLPELYYFLLGLPKTAAELEKQLGVNVDENLRDGRKVVRAGFYESGVSVNNRLVERHVTNFGAYWKSYDFQGSSGEKNLFLRPLGPSVTSLKDFEASFGFKHDGGEMIYNLSNGLQAYFLVNQKDERINSGPVEVVRDRLESAGSPVVVNGLSCIACHDRGMKRFQDAVRESFASAETEANDKVDKLYPRHEEMDKLLDRDQARFMSALAEATKDALGAKTPDDLFKFPEPVSALAQRHNADMTIEDVAQELGLEATGLKTLLAGDLQRTLGTLRQGRSIKREFWESKLRDLSVFQEAAFRAGVSLGPLNVQ